jgi:uncharacterized protein YjbJ (UPF0337 family)
MNRDILETQWPQIRGLLIGKFPNLTEEDIRQINGHYDQLVAKLQQKYGYTREEAEERIRSWNFDRDMAAGTTRVTREEYRSDYVAPRSEDDTSWYKYLLWVGLPLLLLGAYFFSSSMNDRAAAPAPRVMNQQAVVETPAERLISTNIRNALASRSELLQNIQISTHDGVVTISGFVPNAESRAFIDNTAKQIAGVRQVVDNLQVR